MTDFPATDKGLKQRISSYRCSLTKEKQNHNYLDYLYPQIIDAIDAADRNWMAGHYDSFLFRRIRSRYIEVYHELDELEGVEARSVLVDEADELLDLIQ